MKTSYLLSIVCAIVMSTSLFGEEIQPLTRAEDLLPENTMIMIQAKSLADSLESLLKTPLGKAYLEPELQEATATLRQKAANEKARIEMKSHLRLLTFFDAFRTTATLAILDLHKVQGRKDPDPDIVLLMETAKGNTACVQLLDTLKAAIQREHPGFDTTSLVMAGEEVTVYSLGDFQPHLVFLPSHLAVASNRRSMELFLKTQELPRSKKLAESAAYQDVSKRMPKEADLRAFFNIKSLLKIEADVRSGKQNRDLSTLGIDQISAVGFTSHFSDKELKDTLYIHCPDEVSGLLRMLRSEPVDISSLRHAPKETLAVAVASLEPGRIWTEFLLLLEKSEPQKAIELREELPEIETALGFSVVNDLLPSLGNKVVAYVTQNQGSPIPDLVVLSELNDPITFERCLRSLRDVILEKWIFKEVQYHGSTIYYQPTGKLCPAFAVHKDKLIFSLFMPSIKRAILQREKGFVSLDTREDLKRAMQTISKDRSMLVWADFRRIFDVAYNTLYPFAQATPEKELPIEWHAMPAPQTLSRHFGPLLLSITNENTGILIEGSSPLGGAFTVGLGIAVLSNMNKEAEAAKRQITQRPDEQPGNQEDMDGLEGIF